MLLRGPALLSGCMALFSYWTGMTLLIPACFSCTADEVSLPRKEQSAAPAAEVATKAITEDEARRQAQLLHSAVHSILQRVHHGLYREDEGLPLPAAVFRESFADIEAEHNIKLRWLAIEGQAMNTDHLPASDFEKQAAEALKSGELSHEEVRDGTYRRAGRILLANDCLKCHVPDRRSTKPRTAGLIIAIPIADPD